MKRLAESKMKRNNMELVKYRDQGMPTYTYFWINDDQKIVSPFFDSEDDAAEWLNKRLNNMDQVSAGAYKNELL